MFAGTVVREPVETPDRRFLVRVRIDEVLFALGEDRVGAEVDVGAFAPVGEVGDRYVVVATSEERFWLGPCSASFKIAGRELEVEALRARKQGRTAIVGRVSGREGRLAGAEVIATSRLGRFWTKSQEDGQFLLTDVPQDAYYLSSSKDLMQSHTPTVLNRRPVSVGTEQCVVYEPTLLMLGSVTGRVVDFSGLPLVGWRVSLTRVRLQRAMDMSVRKVGTKTEETTTGAEGEFSFRDVDTGDYTVLVQSAPGITEWYLGGPTLDTAETFSLAEGERRDGVVVRLNPWLKIQ